MTPIAKRLQTQLRRSRIALFTLVLPLAAASIMDYAEGPLRLIYIVLGFSLIIFLHELGHFVVARLCSVKCLAFSIGIGPRMCGWRKGGRFTFGNDPYDPETLKEAEKLRQLNEKTSGEREDDKYAKKPLDADTVVVSGNAGPVQIHPDTPDLTGDILGKPVVVPAPHKHHASAVQSDLQTTAYVPPHPRSVGDCDYRISWAPLGGYVRMLGQDDMDPTKISTDPRAFNQRPIWQRMCIVSAGVVMNIIFAAVCFSIIFSPGIGVKFPPARVGLVVYDSPAWKAGIKPGDQILSIDGEKPRGFLEFADVQMAAALSDGKEPIRLNVRHANGKEEVIPVVPVNSPDNGLLSMGIAAMPGLKIGDKAEDFAQDDFDTLWRDRVNFAKNKPEFAKLDDAGYTITKVDDVDLRDPAGTHDKYIPLANEVNAKNGKPVTLTIESDKKPAVTKTLTLYPYIEPLSGVETYPAVFGLVPQVVVSGTEPKSPAANAGLQPGDRIMRVGERSAPDFKQFQTVIRESGGDPITIAVERPAPAPATAAAGTTAAANPTYPAIPAISAKKTGKSGYIIGVHMYPDLQTTRFVPSSAAPQSTDAALPATATIAALDGQAVNNWQDIYAYIRTKNAGDKVAVTFAAGSEPVVRTYTLSKEEADAVREQLHYMLGLSLENETQVQVAANAVQAVAMGLDHTKKFVLNVYSTLRGLSRGTVDPSNLHGIVGITKIGYDVQRRGTVWLWYVLAMVSVNLAVANFLPLPIVDGGLFLLLILEKIRGKPLSLKVQTVIQTVGIVLLAGLFIFVTYNDITGLFLK